MTTVLKTLISPLQTWLLSQGRCVGCSMPLSQGEIKKRKDGTELVTCKCKRVYIHDPKKNTYRRALLSEV